MLTFIDVDPGRLEALWAEAGDAVTAPLGLAGRKRYVAAVSHGAVVGAIWWRPRMRPIGQLGGLFVAPAWRSQGVARRLREEGHRRLWEAGCTHLLVAVRRDRRDLLARHRARGDQVLLPWTPALCHPPPVRGLVRAAAWLLRIEPPSHPVVVLHRRLGAPGWRPSPL